MKKKAKLKNPELISLGQHIRKLRKAAGFSQEDFANHIEMNRGYYGTIERGETNATYLILGKIAKGLDIKRRDLIPPDA